MKIAIVGRKGGVGKTTTTCGLASILSSQKKRVLAIDLDPQSNLAFCLGGDATLPGTTPLLLGQNPPPQAINDYLHVYAADLDLENRTIQQLDTDELDVVLKNFDYDYYLFDCPPGNERLEHLAIVAADLCLICTDPHPMSLMGVGRVVLDLENRRSRGRKCPSEWVLVLSRLDLRRTMDQQLKATLTEQYPDLLQFAMRQDAQIQWATTSAQLLMDYDPKCRFATDIAVIMDWINGQKTT